MVTLHLVCGKIAAGKTTLAAELAKSDRTLLICEDFWLSRLFGRELREAAERGRLPARQPWRLIVGLSRLFGTGLREPADYGSISPRLREAVGPHIVALLRLEISVVLDFSANSRVVRSWMKGIAEAAGANHQLHYLDVSDEVRQERLQRSRRPSVRSLR
jgi:predicted kinase